MNNTPVTQDHQTKDEQDPPSLLSDYESDFDDEEFENEESKEEMGNTYHSEDFRKDMIKSGVYIDIGSGRVCDRGSVHKS